MEMKIKEIADFIDGEIQGDENRVITGVSSLEDAGSTEIAFAGDKKYLDQIQGSNAGAVIILSEVEEELTRSCTSVILRVENPRLSFFRLVARFHPAEEVTPGIADSAQLGEGARLGKNVVLEANVVLGKNVTLGDNCRIMANSYIGDDAILGDNVTLKPNVTLMERTRLGNDVLIHSGTVIGSDGFGFTPAGGGHEKLPHTGHVEIGNNVEIGACNTIDRGTLGTTTLGNGVKTDNQVHIAHNVKVGDNTLIVAQVGIAGSAVIGKNVIIAGKSGISGHLTVGDGTIVGPWSGVSSDVEPGQIVSGVPHMPHKNWLKAANIIPRLPGMRKTLLSLERRVKAMEGNKEKSE
ncbi:MAG: UDP-3-O-(3-hydroxymyristoyl)glucosamine N-acyltransferase [Desulfobacterales bacterium]|nr:UDP-3-O-(3-hydroxymyristoyl)glucosamine N-acyltransferase [Desulfobacterales bacterium]